MSIVPNSISRKDLLQLWVETLSGLTPEQKTIVLDAFNQLHRVAAFDSQLN
ncbi:hypothetical protein H6F90_12880 [Trichocoleus sp. FACHB-591]|uniref:hypothetical protein n=1 Tax=unclassified Trichocoleus TaxID=2628910 RepID=UPI0016862600|nr:MULTISPECIES: hypothetical protein [unclassified Trichocoleus]MBD2096039.1 hypothetical protein [Trichocoleus sp. FACHB-591]MBD2120507.1 hypothetical protein [Trichocoleus sp. FACHB-262]